jgi:polysaccharide biosynthesis transport protein
MFQAQRQSTSVAAGTSDVAVGFAPFTQLDLQTIWTLVWRGKATILRAVAASLFVAFVFLLVAPRQYTAVTQLLIDPSDLRAVGTDLTSNQIGDAAVIQVESQSRVLTSDSVLGRVVGEQGLADDPEFTAPSLIRELTSGLSSMFAGAPRAAADKKLVALDEFKRHVKVTRTDRTYVIDIDVTSKDADKAARLANAIADAYLAEQTKARSDAARQISQSLSGRLKELQDRVRDAEDKVEAFKAQNNIVDANGSGQLVNEQQLSELDRLLEAARSRTADAQARYEQVERVQQSKDPTGAFPEAVQSPTITALRTQYAEIMRREAEQMATLGARHPAVLDIQAQAERLRGMIADEISRVAASAKNEYETAKANQQTLEQNLETLKHTTIDTSSAMVGLRELQREAQASRAVYETFLARARETGEQERLDTKNIQVITKAIPPLNRSWPPSNPVVALAALFVGLASGTGIVLMRASGEPSQPRWTGIRLFRREPRSAAAPTAAAAEPAIPVLAVLPDIDIAFGLNALAEPNSGLATEMRRVYETLHASHEARGNPRILVVASGDDDDTAMVALMLAALAAASQRVLLVDADLERRTLSAIDADRTEAGLVDVAVGRRMLSDVITHDRETDVNLVSFVAPNSRRDRRISDADVRRAFEQTRRFDMVIVAAMDGSRDPSARFFADLVDHIVLVARADQQGEDDAELFVLGLGQNARKVRGAVLTSAAAA